MRTLLLLPLLAGCTFGTVDVTCACDGGVVADTDACGDLEMTCGDYIDHGWQILSPHQDECNAATRETAPTATCTCDFDLPSTCRPTAVND